MIVASNPLLSFVVANAVTRAGFERRGEIIRLTMTMRGGDRPKAAHTEFSDVSVMPRSMWEPWLIFRNRLKAACKIICGAGKPADSDGHQKINRSVMYHISADPKTRAFTCAASESEAASFYAQNCARCLAARRGNILDPFAGAGSTLAAAEAVGYRSIGIEKDARYFDAAREALPKLRAVKV